MTEKWTQSKPDTLEEILTRIGVPAAIYEHARLWASTSYDLGRHDALNEYRDNSEQVATARAREDSAYSTLHHYLSTMTGNRTVKDSVSSPGEVWPPIDPADATNCEACQ